MLNCLKKWEENAFSLGLKNESAFLLQGEDDISSRNTV